MKQTRYYVFHPEGRYPTVASTKPRDPDVKYIEVMPVAEHDERVKLLKTENDILKLKIKNARNQLGGS